MNPMLEYKVSTWGLCIVYKNINLKLYECTNKHKMCPLLTVIKVENDRTSM